MWSFFSRDPIKGFPYEIKGQVPGLESNLSIWSLHEGTAKSNGQIVSIFIYDIASGSETTKQTALASVKRLKTLRHPNVLSFIDSYETDKHIYMVTEYVKPLKVYLQQCNDDSTVMEAAASWGLHQIVKGLSFLSNNVNLVHNNVCMSSMFADVAGEWKLGGIDYMYPASGEGSNYPPIKTLPDLEKYDPPEKKSSVKSKKSLKWSSDMWGLACLIWETFNEELPRASSLKVIGKIPKSLVRNYCELVSANPASRPSPDQFLENCKLPQGFMSNHFVQANLFLEEIQIKESHEKTTFFTDLTNHIDEFPPNYSKHKILPQLLNDFQFGSSGPSVLPPLFKLGKLLDPGQYQAQIVPCVIKLFSSTDRATRIQLLRQLPLFVEHLQPTVVNSQVFPNMVTGFMDSNPSIREQTVKGMLLLAPKLNDNNLNNELMKHFARLQARDEQGPIRTNTTVCLGKMTPFLNSATRHKVISSAFSRAMKDPFPAARIAGVLAMCNTVQYFTTIDCATKALPSLCALTIDPDQQVRENAFKTVKVFLDKLKAASDNPEQAEKMNEEAASAPTNVASTTGWTGWMTTGVSSITSKLYTNKANPSATQNSAAKPSTAPSAPTSATVKQAPDRPEQPEPPKPEAVEESGAGEGWDDEWTPEDVPDDNEEVKEEDDAYDGWDNDTWISDAQQSSQKEARNEGWDDASWAADPPSKTEQKRVGPEDATWGKGWEDDGWDDGKASSKPTNKGGSDIAPSSTYDWSQDAKNTEHQFFSSFDAKKGKTKKATLLKPTSKPAPAKTKPVKTPSPTKTKSEGWTDDGWDESGWGDKEEDEGLSKAEKLKREREEKRRQRQKQLQEKRASKGGSKLGARKCD